MGESLHFEIAVVGVAASVGLMHAEGTRFAPFGSGTQAVFGDAVHRVEKGIFQREKFSLCFCSKGESAPVRFWMVGAPLCGFTGGFSAAGFLPSGGACFFASEFFFVTVVTFAFGLALALLAMLPNTFALGDFRVLFAILWLKKGEYVASSLAQCKGILDPRVLSSFTDPDSRGLRRVPPTSLLGPASSCHLPTKIAVVRSAIGIRFLAMTGSSSSGSKMSSGAGSDVSANRCQVSPFGNTGKVNSRGS